MKKIMCILLVAIVSSCSSTHIEQSWRDPAVTVDVSQLNKVLVVALLKDEANRRATEDELCSMLNGKGVPSYNYLTKNITKEQEETIREKVKDQGFDGVIIMRLAAVDKDVQYVPGTYPMYYGRFWGYYWNAWNAFYDPGYYKTTRTYRVETNVYSLKRDKLIWSGITSTVDPSGVDKLMKSSSKAVYKEMKKQGFITGV
ncbi:DUF4136 domain-containing protein [Chitinophaga silvisoli]|uniref:DUF4136 domain-containing protein n=1 Tax=Chitinophaga silvisoli TaxID=2291814 RepID=A0A3E1NWI7_9BACT|nr:hypothetical protein [Chitinophaga silvisoli]RFM32291.1 hypothetical protein DXN04_26325 [Chitinophaga silvisoli]